MATIDQININSEIRKDIKYYKNTSLTDKFITVSKQSSLNTYSYKIHREAEESRGTKATPFPTILL